jgi:epoxide hydrolase-like predicted phosphatase
MFKRFSIFAFILFSASLFSNLVIVDFGGVLGVKNKRIAASKLGMVNMGSLFTFFSNPKIFMGTQAKLYSYLEKIPASEGAKLQQSSDLYADDDDGNKIPAIMVDWLRGDITGKQLIEMLEKVKFEKESDRSIILKAAGALLPENLVEILEPNEAMFRLVKECKKRGHKVILLSNLDEETFKLLRAKHPKKFELFDSIYISAVLKDLKPRANIFEIVLKQEGVDPSECIFIDDSRQNIKMSEKLGIPSIHHVDVAKTTKLLKKLI